MTLRFSLLKALPVALSAALGTLMVGWGEDAGAQPCIRTHESLNLGCLTRSQWDRKIQEWASKYSEHWDWDAQHPLDNLMFGSSVKNPRHHHNAFHLKSINADRAYAHVKALMGKNAKPGQGVTIGFQDDYVYPHPWFADTKVTNIGYDFYLTRQHKQFTNFNHLPPPGYVYHGMSGAAVAAGRGGVAPGADLVMLRYNGNDDNAWLLPKGSPEWWQELDNGMSRHYNRLLSQNIDILNITSYADYLGGIIEDYSTKYQSNLRKNYRKTLDVLAQKNAKDKVIIVRSAGNRNHKRAKCSTFSSEPERCKWTRNDIGMLNASSPIIHAGLPALAPELRGHFIVVVSMYSSGGRQYDIATSSNRCGIAADWCIAAPSGITVPKFYKFVDANGISYRPDTNVFIIKDRKTYKTKDRTVTYHAYDRNDKKINPNVLYQVTVDEVSKGKYEFFMQGYSTYEATGEAAARAGFLGGLLLGDPVGPKIKLQEPWTAEWFSGTSAAAPMVSGSLAVMKSLFRGQLSSTELVTRLFATANKTGIYANRAIYGQGMLDLGAATNPWGMVGLMGPGQSVGAQGQQDSPGEADGEVEPSEANACGKGTIKTHPSLELGCLTREKLNEKVQEWATAYRAVPGFAKQWGLGAINADRAYAHLKAVRGESVKPGQGVTIGFVDSGMDLAHPSFAASKVEQKLMRGATSANRSHGTAVASVAAGGRISSGPHQSKAHHGVAWGADVAMFAIPAEVYPVTRAVYSIKEHVVTIPNGGKEMVGLFARDKADAEFFKSVLSEDIDILNLSFPSAPFPGTIDDYRKSRLQKNYDQTIAALAQADGGEKTILVWSAGDVDPSRSQTPGSSPQLMAGLPARIKELRGHSVAVVATKQDGAIADFSNRCGRAAQWCIAAPGQNVRVASSSSQGWSTLSSTSVAAPMVSGGLAVMKQLFRDQLSNTALVSRLFSTAKKDGIHADTSVYGQGLMDLGAATNPWGITAFMGSGQAVGAQSRGDSVGGQGGGVELSSTSLSLGSAMGDGLSEALARQEIAAFDSLGAPFWFSAGSFTLPAEGPSLAARFQQFLAPAPEHTIPESWQVDFQNAAPALEAGHLALTHGADRLSFHGPQGLSATLFQRPADYDQAPLAGLAVSWNPQSLPALSLAAGYLHEPEELLGSQGSGAFGELSGHTLFLSAELDTTTHQGWQLSAQGELGMVNPAVARSQFISDISTLTSSAFRLQARKPLENGAAFRLALSQPLRVESGGASLSLPTGRTKDGLVVGTDLNAPLSPSGRQLDLTAQVDLPLLGGELSLAATHSQQPQHQQGAEGQWTFFTGYRATW